MLRDLVLEINPNWASTPHKSYPDLFKGKIAKRLKRERAKANKSSDRKLSAMIGSSLRAIPQIEGIFMQAYAIRIIADYEPDIFVQFADAKRFSLNDINITQAHSWQEKLSPLVDDIRATWKQFNA